MTTIELERERRLIDLLDHAIDHPEENRRDILKAVCDDDALVEEVLQLLADEDDDFLARPAIEELVGYTLTTPGDDVRSLLRDDNDSYSALPN